MNTFTKEESKFYLRQQNEMTQDERVGGRLFHEGETATVGEALGGGGRGSWGPLPPEMTPITA